MAVAVVTQIHGHMTGEEQQITGLCILQFNGIHWEAFLNIRIPVDENAAEHISHGAESGAVNTVGRLAAPAVVGIFIAKAGLHQLRSQGIFVIGNGLCVILTQNAFLHVAGLPIGQLNFHPAILRFADRCHQSTQRQRLFDPALNLRSGQNITEILVQDHLFGHGLPGLHRFIIQQQIFITDDALIAVVGFNLQPAGRYFIQNFNHHAAENFIHQGRLTGIFGIQAADRYIYNCFHVIYSNTMVQ